MVLSVGISSCPNDTFIFDAMLHNKIDTEGLSFNLKIADIEELNKLAFNHELDITKLSFFAYAYLIKNYVLLNSGSALGNKNGPLLISKQKIYKDEIDYLKIAIPGKYTTANLLLSIAYPNAKNKIQYLFSDIEEVVLSNEADAGLIIHENRFTYKEKGLKKILDLGEYWENLTELPIPLGGIVVKRNIDLDVQQKVDRILKRSIEFALKNPRSCIDFMKKYAQEMKEDIMYKHVKLYVNDYTINLDEKGRKAINELYKRAEKLKIIDKIDLPIFVE
ncbi:MAG: 1,4-dihydroxy-6-naphthoate synthase [Bacteroidales bacterium]|nr:1,4-dihydroxy-6-naphthoate synthase [Bacteroidales bacterium]